MTVSGKRYRAFISYSQKDRGHARRLHRALEAFRAPKGVLADGLDPKTRKLGRFFRDEEDLGAAPDLSETLREQIANAEALIVICSPHAAQSVWVNREIIQFKRTGRADRIFAVIVDGEPNAAASANIERRKTECFPPALKVKVAADGTLTDQPEEPLGIDLRRDGFARGRARLAAGLLDVSFDDLWQRDRRRATGRMVAWVAASVAVVAAAGGGAWYAYDGAQQAGRLGVFAQRAETAVNTAVATAERIAGALTARAAMQDGPAVEAQWRAARMVYALALSGGAKDAAPLLERLGYVKTLTAAQAGQPTPGAGWAFAFARSRDGKPTIIDLKTGKTAPINVEGYSEPVFSPDGRWMVMGDGDGALGGWDMTTGVRTWRFTGDNKEFQRLVPAFPNKGDVLAVGGRGQFWILDPATGKVRETVLFQDHEAPASDYDPNPDASSITFSRDDARLHLMIGGVEVRAYDLVAKSWGRIVKVRDQGYGAKILPGADGDHLIVLGEVKVGDVRLPTIEPTDLRTGKAIRQVRPSWCSEAPADPVKAYCLPGFPEYSADLRFVAMGGLGVRNDPAQPSLTTVYKFDVFDLSADTPAVAPKFPACQQQQEQVYNQCEVVNYSVAPSGGTVAVSMGSGAVFLFDMASGDLVRTFEPAAGGVTSLQFAAGGSKLIGLAHTATMSSSRGLIWVWDVASGRAVSRSGNVDLSLLIPAISEDASRILLSSGLLDVDLWQALSPVNETAAEALKRICGWRGADGLKLSDEEFAMLPRSSGRSNDLCTWKAS